MSCSIVPNPVARMDFNPYEQAPFGGRLSGNAREARIRPESILPPSDNTMPTTLRLGWFLLSRAAWPERGYFNVVFIYGVMRRRRSWFEPILHFAPWVLLTAAEVVGVMIAGQAAGSFRIAWFGMVLGELLLLPAGLGLFLLIFLMNRLQAGVEGLTLPELVCAPVKGDEIVYALLALPMSMQALALFCNSLILITLYSYTVVLELPTFGTWQDGVVIGLLFLLAIRFYLLRALCSHAAACAVRVVLMVADPTDRFVRALRDYFFPYAAWLLALPLLSMLMMSIFLGSVCLAMIVVPLGMALSASMAELEAGSVLVWLGKLHTHWAPLREDDSPWVPSRLRDKWSNRDPSKPLRSRVLR